MFVKACRPTVENRSVVLLSVCFKYGTDALCIYFKCITKLHKHTNVYVFPKAVNFLI